MLAYQTACVNIQQPHGTYENKKPQLTTQFKGNGKGGAHILRYENFEDLFC